MATQTQDSQSKLIIVTNQNVLCGSELVTSLVCVKCTYLAILVHVCINYCFTGKRAGQHL
jgi:hypothetical protein